MSPKLPYGDLERRVALLEALLQRKEEELMLVRAEAAGQVSRLDAVLAALPVGVAIVDERGGHVQGNEQFLRTWAGCRPVSGIDDCSRYKAWWADGGRAVRAEEWASAQAVIEGRTVTGQILEIERFDGTRAFVHNSAAPIRNAAGQVVGAAVAIQDITELRRAEESRRAGEARYRSLAENVPSILMRYDSNMRMEYISPQSEALTGIPAENWMGKTNREAGMPEHLCSIWDEAISEVFRTGERRELEYDFPAASGPRAFSLILAPERDTAGAVRHVLGISTDVTAHRRVDEELRISQRRLRALIANLPGGAVFLVDRDLRYLLAGGEALRTAGMTPEDLEGRTISEALDPAVAASHELHYRQALAGQAFIHEHQSYGRIYITRGVPLRNASGEVEAVLAFSYDITDRKRAEQALVRSEQRFRAFVEASSQAVWSADAAGYSADARAWLEEFAGLKAGPGEDADWLRAAMHPEDYPHWHRERVQTLLTHEPLEVEARIQRRDGSWRWVRINSVPIHEEDGTFREWVGTIVDITEQKAAAEAVQASEERFAFALEAAQTGAWDLDLVHHTAHRSLIHDRIFGYESLLPHWSYEMFLEHVLPEERAMVHEKFGRAIESKSDWSFECRIRRRDGEIRWIWAAGRHRSGQSGIPHRMAGIVQDITERKRAEDELHRTSRLLEGTLNNTHVLIACMDRDFNFLMVNENYARADGREVDFFPGKNHFALFPNAGNEAIFRRVVETGDPFYVLDKPFEYARNLERGVSYWDWSLRPIKGAGGGVAMLVLTLLDVTERHRALEALRASEEQFRRAIEEAPIPVIMHAEDGQVLQISRTWTELTGYRLSEVPTLDAWLSRACGTGADAFRTQVQRLFREGSSTLNMEFPILTRDGGTRHWSFTAATPGKLADGRRFVVGMAVDITEHKRADEVLRRAKDELEIRVGERTAELAQTARRLAQEVAERKRAEESAQTERRRFLEVLETLPVMIRLLTPDRRVPFANRAFRDAFGSANGRTCFEYAFHRTEPCPECQSFVPFESGRPHHWEWTIPDGRTIDIYSFPFTDSDGRSLILEMKLDISDRRRAEQTQGKLTTFWNAGWPNERPIWPARIMNWSSSPTSPATTSRSRSGR